MNTLAVVLEKPHSIVLNELELASPQEDDVVVDVEWSGISSGTEKLLWSGRMPHFPGMGYPLVPGYESIGRVTAAGEGSGHGVGELVFVPGANCFGDVRGLFGGTASRLVVPGHRALPIDEDLGKQGLLLALAATAQHAVSRCGNRGPELIVGHGVLGRLVARLTILASGAAPVEWGAIAWGVGLSFVSASRRAATVRMATLSSTRLMTADATIARSATSAATLPFSTR